MTSDLPPSPAGFGRVLVAGSYNSDLTVLSPTLPSRGQTVLGDRLEVGHGGKGHNQAVAAKRLGADVTFLVKLGCDEFAAGARSHLGSEGLPAAGILEADTHTGVALIMVDAAGDNMISVAPGANALLTAADLGVVEPRLPGTTHALFQLECPVALFVGIARWCRQHSVTTVLNPAPAAPLTDEVYALCDVLTPNETELAALTGASLGEDGTLAGGTVVEAARQLIARGAGRVVVTLAERGGVEVTPAAETWFEPYAVTPVDSTGAGDAFNGGLLAGLAAGLAMPDAIDLAMRAGAYCVTRVGVLDGLATLAELDAALPSRRTA